jgi:hypothetical protein
MNRFVVLLLVPCELATPAFACNAPLFEMIDAALPAQPGKTFDVTDVQSTEGGEWNVYFAPDGPRLTNLVRTDYGELGRSSTRLIVSSPDAYAVAKTNYMYHAILDATDAVEETHVFVFCQGKLSPPEQGLGTNPEYQKDAETALKTFDAPEVAEYVKGLKRGK